MARVFVMMADTTRRCTGTSELERLPLRASCDRGSMHSLSIPTYEAAVDFLCLNIMHSRMLLFL
jgi:hypothetical protein